MPNNTISTTSKAAAEKVFIRRKLLSLLSCEEVLHIGLCSKSVRQEAYDALFIRADSYAKEYQLSLILFWFSEGNTTLAYHYLNYISERHIEANLNIAYGSAKNEPGKALLLIKTFAKLLKSVGAENRTARLIELMKLMKPFRAGDHGVGDILFLAYQRGYNANFIFHFNSLGSNADKRTVLHKGLPDIWRTINPETKAHLLQEVKNKIYRSNTDDNKFYEVAEELSHFATLPLSLPLKVNVLNLAGELLRHGDKHVRDAAAGIYESQFRRRERKVGDIITEETMSRDISSLDTANKKNLLFYCYNFWANQVVASTEINYGSRFRQKKGLLSIPSIESEFKKIWPLYNSEEQDRVLRQLAKDIGWSRNIASISTSIYRLIPSERQESFLSLFCKMNLLNTNLINTHINSDNNITRLWLLLNDAERSMLLIQFLTGVSQFNPTQAHHLARVFLGSILLDQACFIFMSKLIKQEQWTGQLQNKFLNVLTEVSINEENCENMTHLVAMFDNNNAGLILLQPLINGLISRIDSSGLGKPHTADTATLLQLWNLSSSSDQLKTTIIETLEKLDGRRITSYDASIAKLYVNAWYWLSNNKLKMPQESDSQSETLLSVVKGLLSFNSGFFRKVLPLNNFIKKFVVTDFNRLMEKASAVRYPPRVDYSRACRYLPILWEFIPENKQTALLKTLVHQQEFWPYVLVMWTTKLFSNSQKEYITSYFLACLDNAKQSEKLLKQPDISFFLYLKCLAQIKSAKLHDVLSAAKIVQKDCFNPHSLVISVEDVTKPASSSSQPLPIFFSAAQSETPDNLHIDISMLSLR